MRRGEAWCLHPFNPARTDLADLPLPDLSAVHGLVIQKAVPGRRKLTKTLHSDMPYYVYAVKPMAQLEKLAEFASLQGSLRASQGAACRRSAGGPLPAIKVMFADNPLAAEDLMLQVREAPPDGDD